MDNFFPISRFTRTPIMGDFDSMIDAFFNEPLRRKSNSSLVTVPAANVLSTDEGYTIQLAIPGYSRDDFSVSYENGALTVAMNETATTTSNDTASANWKTVRQEYSYSGFTRSWSLPEGASVSNISARYDAGILSVYVPVENANSNQVTIAVD